MVTSMMEMVMLWVHREVTITINPDNLIVIDHNSKINSRPILTDK